MFESFSFVPKVTIFSFLLSSVEEEEEDEEEEAHDVIKV